MTKKATEKENIINSCYAVKMELTPESVKVLWNAIKEVFLFSPEKHVVDEIKTYVKEKCK